ncbi:helix-turn-helix transcriptional regulator [Phenylobacterium sp.]|uniref:helix-turn-helix domain-containing protein n=1 Tax=Phenylobacterium sp. TaxID=1871053 RepID=UPI0035AE0F36
MQSLSDERSAVEAFIRQTGEISLSARQLECLYWVQEGKSSRDIGAILGVSHRIVERHVFRACRKLEVRTRLQAVIRARTLGLLHDSHPMNR